MVTVSWSNATYTSAPTWEALEERVRKEQWHVWDADEFRDAMAKRCWRWSGTRIEIAGSSRAFFHELQRAGLVVIEKDGDEQLQWIADRYRDERSAAGRDAIATEYEEQGGDRDALQAGA